MHQGAQQSNSSGVAGACPGFRTFRSPRRLTKTSRILKNRPCKPTTTIDFANFSAKESALVRRSAFLWILVSVVVVLLGSPAAFAAGNGAIGGTVIDQSGAVVPGATVTITNTALSTPFTAVTDAKGLYG